MRYCVDCGGRMEPVKVKNEPNRVRHYLKCEYCDFQISANEGDIKALSDTTTPPPKIVNTKIDY